MSVQAFDPECKPRRVLHRDAPVRCAACGKVRARKSRQQLFCSTRCRKRAHYANAVARGDFARRPMSESANGTNPRKKSSIVNGLQARKAAPRIDFSAPLNILGGQRLPNAKPLEPALRQAIVCAEVGGQR